MSSISARAQMLRDDVFLVGSWWEKGRREKGEWFLWRERRDVLGLGGWGATLFVGAEIFIGMGMWGFGDSWGNVGGGSGDLSVFKDRTSTSSL